MIGEPSEALESRIQNYFADARIIESSISHIDRVILYLRAQSLQFSRETRIFNTTIRSWKRAQCPVHARGRHRKPIEISFSRAAFSRLCIGQRSVSPAGSQSRASAPLRSQIVIIYDWVKKLNVTIFRFPIG